MLTKNYWGRKELFTISAIILFLSIMTLAIHHPENETIKSSASQEDQLPILSISGENIDLAEVSKIKSSLIGEVIEFDKYINEKYLVFSHFESLLINNASVNSNVYYINDTQWDTLFVNQNNPSVIFHNILLPNHFDIINITLPREARSIIFSQNQILDFYELPKELVVYYEGSNSFTSSIFLKQSQLTKYKLENVNEDKDDPYPSWRISTSLHFDEFELRNIDKISRIETIFKSLSEQMKNNYRKLSISTDEINSPLLNQIYSKEAFQVSIFSNYLQLFIPLIIIFEMVILYLTYIKISSLRSKYKLLYARGFSHFNLFRSMWFNNVLLPTLIIPIYYIVINLSSVQPILIKSINVILIPWFMMNFVGSTAICYNQWRKFRNFSINKLFITNKYQIRVAMALTSMLSLVFFILGLMINLKQSNFNPNVDDLLSIPLSIGYYIIGIFSLGFFILIALIYKIFYQKITTHRLSYRLSLNFLSNYLLLSLIFVLLIVVSMGSILSTNITSSLDNEPTSGSFTGDYKITLPNLQNNQENIEKIVKWIERSKDNSNNNNNYSILPIFSISTSIKTPSKIINVNLKVINTEMYNNFVSSLNDSSLVTIPNFKILAFSRMFNILTNQDNFQIIAESDIVVFPKNDITQINNELGFQAIATDIIFDMEYLESKIIDSFQGDLNIYSISLFINFANKALYGFEDVANLITNETEVHQSNFYISKINSEYYSPYENYFQINEIAKLTTIVFIYIIVGVFVLNDKVLLKEFSYIYNRFGKTKIIVNVNRINFLVYFTFFSIAELFGLVYSIFYDSSGLTIFDPSTGYFEIIRDQFKLNIGLFGILFIAKLFIFGISSFISKFRINKVLH